MEIGEYTTAQLFEFGGFTLERGCMPIAKLLRNGKVKVLQQSRALHMRQGYKKRSRDQYEVNIEKMLQYICNHQWRFILTGDYRDLVKMTPGSVAKHLGISDKAFHASYLNRSYYVEVRGRNILLNDMFIHRVNPYKAYKSIYDMSIHLGTESQYKLEKVLPYSRSYIYTTIQALKKGGKL